jgi:Zn-dependent protease
MSYKIGRVEGIDLYLHPTFLLLLAYTLAFSGGLLATLLTAAVFGCVLLHELGHALMARHYGIRTEDITLYPIGGVARLERMPRSAGPELLIALAGPAVNLVIAGGLFLGLELAGPGSANMVGNFLFQLMAINLGLALFNLLPVFPMDGGRVLRAILSAPLGRLRATSVAASIGQFIAIAAGLYFLINGELLPVVLAAFVYFAAGAELRSVREEEFRRSVPTDVYNNPPPPGFRWVTRGDGIWTLAPIMVQARGPQFWR